MRYPLLLLTVLLIGCKKDPPAPMFKADPSFETTTVVDLVPVSDGSVYAMTDNDGLWYIRGGTAIHVKGSEAIAFTFGDLLPTAGSLVYINSWNHADLPPLLLKDGQLQLIREVFDHGAMDTISALPWTPLVGKYVQDRAEIVEGLNTPSDDYR